MIKKEYSDALNKSYQELLKAIESNYSVNLPIVEPEYDADGKLINETVIKKQNDELKRIISAIWLANYAVMQTADREVIDTNFVYYNAIKDRLKKPVYTRSEINSMIDDIVKERSNAVKIKQVIKGNADVLNNRMQKKIKDSYQNLKTKKDIEKMIKKEFGINSNRAKTIATTEVNYYRSEAQLQATSGLNVKKVWRHKYAREPRPHHLAADGQEVYGHDAMFNIGGIETIAPQHFGIASEDINCHCQVEIILLEKGATQVG